MNEELQRSFNIIKQVCASISAPLKDHEQIQLAIRNIEAALQHESTEADTSKK